ncbi:PstS family phosphate ABC transporter substrate-binding protein [Pontibacter silvestris]|uniref:PstS family phosphate ABC transporter substrate-binding protein n=1 Tax=Pontibacter silvestris TaxID=2305183 RepID=A0ABW4WW52_9BACT|nr:substrate-binding domain-containing protein [Pontibacter silvestris]MCC9136406.1 substrate-binding domain-containing protein [Pontibacter silvestris]
MNSKIINSILCATLVALFSCGGSSTETSRDTPTSGNIKVSVDESFQPVIESQVNTFESIYKYADLDEAYKPEKAVIEDLLNDSVRVAVISRELTAEEKEVFDKRKIIPRSTKIAIDAVALIVNNSNPDSLLTLDQVKQIFNSQLTNWKQLNQESGLDGDITIVFDNSNSSTARYIRDSLTTGQKLPQNSFASDSHTALIDYVSENKNAIGIIGVNWISDVDDSTVVGFRKRVKVVGISSDPNPVTTESYYQPYQAYISQEVYPLRRFLYIISTEGRSGLGTGFASFVAGDQGQRIMLKSGLVPATMPVRVIGLRND